MIPIVILCYNNHIYVNNTIKQLEKINKEYLPHIIVLDDISTDKDTIEFLNKTSYTVIRNESKMGPRIWNNPKVYDTLPNQFVLTDPDLEFNTDIPSDFIEQLIQLSNEYNCNKVGLALDISDSDKFYPGIYCLNKTIAEWESQYWNKKIVNTKYELYDAEIDTTFCVCKKDGNTHLDIRVAGNFTTKHLPWYIDNPLESLTELYQKYNNNSNHKHSTTGYLIFNYLRANYTILNGGDKPVLLKKPNMDVRCTKTTIDIRDIKTLYVCPDHDTKYNKRKQHMEALLKDMGFKDIVFYKSTSADYPHCLTEAYIDILTNYIDEPILILGDDVETTGLNPILYDIPEASDAIYLGLSLGNIRVSHHSSNYARINKMAGVHAILYLTKSYKLAVIEMFKKSLTKREVCDVGLMDIQCSFNIYASKDPFFYQSNKLNETDLEKVTKFIIGNDLNFYYIK